MYKASSKIAREAESLYNQHKEIVDSIEKKKQYLQSAKDMQALMAESAINAVGVNLDLYMDSMDADIYDVKSEVTQLEAQSDVNLETANSHLNNNPRLYDIAVKEAKKDGIKIKH